MDKKRKQITLYEPVNSNAHNDTPEERKCTVSAPKMFAFDALFADDDPLVRVSFVAFYFVFIRIVC